MTLVTIVIPVYNAEKFIADTIQSVLNQTYTDFILLIVNDGSKDKSMEIVRRFKDSRITILDDGLKAGLCPRLNQIASIVKTKYLARMDADDIMHYDRIRRQMEILENNETIDVLGANAIYIDDNNIVKGIRLSNTKSIIRVKAFIHPTIIAKTEWFQKNKYDECAIRIEDAELWDRCKNDNFYITTEPLLFYREFGGEYYKKYKHIKSPFLISKKYFLNKNTSKAFQWWVKGVVYLFKFIIYFFANKFKIESMLIDRRRKKYNEIDTATAILLQSIEPQEKNV